MRRITLGLIGVAALGAALFTAPMLWSQPPNDRPRAPVAGETSPNDPDAPGFRRPGGGPDGFGPDGFGFGDFGPGRFGGPGEFGPGGPGGFSGRGGPPVGRPGGGPGGQTMNLVARFDVDGDGRLDRQQRDAARESLSQDRGGPGPGGRGSGPMGGRGVREPAQPGPRVAPSDVESYPDAELYEPTILRTLFLDFEHDDWEDELAAFKSTDVEVPATLTVDGKPYPNVGVRFRGMSSYMMVPAGYKRSLNLSLDFVDTQQRLYGYKTLNLLNASGDPTLFSSVLYSHIARRYIPAPKANLVKVVINGESWGIYTNVQQLNKEFIAENYPSAEGARWKVSGSPNADGGLRYLGENIDEYRRRYEIKSKDREGSWQQLIALCRVLDETPTEQWEQSLAPMLDIDSTLWFLALDVVLVNSDGYWTRASDYYLFQNADGKFHVIPYDINEAFQDAGGGPGGLGPPPGRGPGAELLGGFPKPPGGPRDFGRGPGGGPGGGLGRGGPPGGGPGRGGTELDPLVSLDDPYKPLRSKLLQVPQLRERYLDCVRTIAEQSLDWNHLGPVVAAYRRLIEQEVAADTKKLISLDAFLQATADSPGQDGRTPGLRSFAEKRREFLLTQ